MPTSLARRCCSASSNWCATCAAWSVTRGLPIRIVAAIASDDRPPVEVVARRWRRRLPLEPGRTPRVRGRGLAVPERPEEIGHRQDVAEPEDRRARRREDVQHLELRRILPVPARHPEVAEDEL